MVFLGAVTQSCTRGKLFHGPHVAIGVILESFLDDLADKDGTICHTSRNMGISPHMGNDDPMVITMIQAWWCVWFKRLTLPLQ